MRSRENTSDHAPAWIELKAFHSVRPKDEGLMPRKLKAYQTSLGFFDLAIAAPSMKAALEAWGSEANLFHQGFAREADDPTIIAATMAKPGVVLRRAVGSNASFSEHAEFPKDLHPVEVNGMRGKRAPESPAAPPPHKLHNTKTEKIAATRSALDRQMEVEEIRWDKQRAKLQAALNRARNGDASRSAPLPFD